MHLDFGPLCPPQKKTKWWSHTPHLKSLKIIPESYLLSLAQHPKYNKLDIADIRVCAYRMGWVYNVMVISNPTTIAVDLMLWLSWDYDHETNHTFAFQKRFREYRYAFKIGQVL